MNSQFMKWQLAACGILSILLLVEWALGEANRKELQALLDKKIQSEYQSEPLQKLSLSKQTEDNFNTIVERPLFIEGRKPLPEKVPDAKDAEEVSQLDDWLLIGIYSNKNQPPVALFRNQKEAKKFLKLTQGQAISSWKIKTIQSDRVVLQQGSQEKSVMLLKPMQQTKTSVNKAQPPRSAAKPKRPDPPVKAVTPTPPTNPIAPTNDPSEENDIDEN